MGSEQDHSSHLLSLSPTFDRCFIAFPDTSGGSDTHFTIAGPGSMQEARPYDCH